MSKRITVYSPKELKRKNPSAFEKAHSEFNYNDSDIPWQDEIMDSFKAVFKAGGIRIRDYEISACSYSWVNFDMEDEVRDLKGPRAMAWLENNLLADLRIPFKPMFTRFTLPNGEITEYQPTHRGELSQYGQYYRAGMIKPCPFTGVCFDDDFIDSLVKDIKAGETLGDAYENLARVAGKAFESEIEYQNSEEHFLEQDHLQFTIDGHEV